MVGIMLYITDNRLQITARSVVCFFCMEHIAKIITPKIHPKTLPPLKIWKIQNKNTIFVPKILNKFPMTTTNKLPYGKYFSRRIESGTMCARMGPIVALV